MDTITILHECMKKYPAVATELVENTSEAVEEATRTPPRATSRRPPNSAHNARARIRARNGHLRPLLRLHRHPRAQHTLIDGGLDAASNAGSGSAPEEGGPDLELEIHRIDLLSNLLFAFDGLGDKQSAAWVDRVQAFMATFNAQAAVVRASLYSDLEKNFFFFNEFNDVLVVSDEQYEALEAFKAGARDATLEIVKSGKTDKLIALEQSKKELNTMVDVKFFVSH
ncbi:hypothetical protein BDK51DRAFT_48506 [Blyttiomyces helicus]|uniref:Uncharacterized protein n=1 Tax=Blyttiomyces helicus TaxID=388810 RepID=A0A4P9W0F3_9FUNG|nr:hypothetical protein BDK51DRAFT_48506 [Blyttiomyces helicus]|eukprot:RKO84583.1 hypothetical protein BDK51DRAFT_48506 [Blyttiomyces helicus]